MEDVRLHCLAGSQHWLITHDQLLGLGYSDRKVELRLASGFFVRVHRGVYRLRGAKPAFESNVLAACMVSPPIGRPALCSVCAGSSLARWKSPWRASGLPGCLE